MKNIKKKYKKKKRALASRTDFNPYVGGSHSGAYMMWGENGSNDAGTYANGWHGTFKNAHGGILAFVR